MKIAAVLAVPAALGAAGFLAWRRWQHQCCEITSENYDDLVVCPHGKAWYRGVPTVGAVGPFGYMRVPGWKRVTTSRAMRIMNEELDIELISFAEISEEEDGGGYQDGRL